VSSVLYPDGSCFLYFSSILPSAVGGSPKPLSLQRTMLAPTIKVDDVVEINYKEKGNTVANKGSNCVHAFVHVRAHACVCVCVFVCVSVKHGASPRVSLHAPFQNVLLLICLDYCTYSLPCLLARSSVRQLYVNILDYPSVLTVPPFYEVLRVSGNS